MERREISGTRSVLLKAAALRPNRTKKISSAASRPQVFFAPTGAPRGIFTARNFVCSLPTSGGCYSKPMLSDGELLRRYLEENSETAFTTLVQRHISMVYRAAYRRVGGDAHAADDVVQKVFSALARKAATLSDRTNLAGWLYTGTRFAAGEAVRAARRRQAQETEAHRLHTLEGRTEVPGERLDLILDEVMDLLHERDRDALVLHFFEGMPFHEAGKILSLSADATRMRVNRSLERLRAELMRRGVASTAAALTTLLSAPAAFSAPARLVGEVVRHALVPSGATARGGTWLRQAWRMTKSSPGVSTVGVGVVGVVVFLAVRSTPPQTFPLEVGPTTVATNLVSGVRRAEGRIESIAFSSPLPATESAAAAALPANAPRSSAGRADSAVTASSRFDQLSANEKTLLKQLWAIHRYYGETPGRVFVFSLEPQNPRFGEFSSGRDLLLARGWVKLTGAGGVFLNGAGRAFSEANAQEIEAYPSMFRLPDGSAPATSNSDFAALSRAEKAILKKLWSMENEGKVSGRRLGINLATTSPGFETFAAGRDALVARGWVAIGAQKGMIFLRPAGRAFCEANQAEIALQPSPPFSAAMH